MKKVLFNLERTQPVASVKRHGGGIYGEVVFRRIAERGLPVEAVYDSRRWLNPEMKELCDRHNIPLHDLAAYPSTKDGIQRIADTRGIEVLYTPLLVAGINELEGIDIVCTVHGLRDYELPADWFSLRYPFKAKALVKQLLFLTVTDYMRRRGSKIYGKIFANPRVKYVTVSEHSRTSIQLFSPSQRGKDIPVFYSPNTATVEPSERWSGGVLSENEKPPYFLMVSGNRWEKNNLRAIIALDRLYSDGSIENTRTVITGVKNPKQFRYRLRNPEKFIFPGYVDDDVLTALYRDAYFFIYPTLNEGFGYPPIEAMRFGTPAIVSPVTSVSEICGDAPLYINPYDIKEIQMRILRSLDPDLHTELSRRSLDRFRYISNRQAADLDRLVDMIYSINS